MESSCFRTSAGGAARYHRAARRGIHSERKDAMRRIGCILLLLVIWAAAALGEGAEITYREYGGKITVPADAEQIDMGKLKVGNFDAFEKFLDQLPNLRRVDMYATHTFKKQAARLSERYPQIEFGWTLYFGDHTIRSDQTVFSTKHDSIMRRHTTEELEVLRYCRALRALDLGHNDLTDISFLAELTDLRLLILADNRIEDLSPLKGLERLEYIELFDNRVASAAPLAGLPRLMDLNIAQNRLESTAPLCGMTQLKRLWMHACCGGEAVIAEADIQALRAALPGAQIDTASLGTDGGWREHPHYDVLFQMFKGKDYLPFEDSFTDGEML